MKEESAAWRRALSAAAGSAVLLASPVARPAQVVEFYNGNLDNYFITADAIEAAAVDSGGAGPRWERTGDTFAEGGIDPVCRFYGSAGPGRASCGGPGVEFGRYTWDGATGTLTVTAVSIDTNGCAGLNEPPGPGVLFGPGDHSLSGIVLGNGGTTLSGDGVLLRRLTP